MTCKLSQGVKMSNDGMKNIALDTSDGWIVPDQRIKTIDGWVDGVNFLYVMISVRRPML